MTVDDSYAGGIIWQRFLSSATEPTSGGGEMCLSVRGRYMDEDYRCSPNFIWLVIRPE